MQVVNCQDALDCVVFQSIVILLPKASQDRHMKQAVVSPTLPPHNHGLQADDSIVLFVD